MRNSIVKAYALGIITGSFLTAGLTFGIGTAKADGMLSPLEEAFVEANATLICTYIDGHHTTGGVLHVGEVITRQGFTADSAVDIINASVQAYCPRNWSLLVAIGKAARGENVA